MKHLKQHLLVWLSATFFMLSTSNPALAEPQLIDRIVAIAEDDVVLASEIRDHLQTVVKNAQRSGARLPNESVLYEQVLNRLILDKLQVQRAQRIGMRISDQELNKSLDNIARQNNMSLPEFRQALENDGVSYVDIREQTRKDLILRKIQQRSVMRNISISPSEIDNFLASEAGKKLLQVEYSIDHVLLPVDDINNEERVEKARQTALQLAKLATEQTQFIDIRNDIDQAGATHAPLGWRSQNDIPSILEDAVLQLATGEVSEPILSDSGFHLVRINQTRGGVSEQETEHKVRHILLTETEIRNEAQIQELLNEISLELDKGTPFSHLARIHSDDPGSALKGGDLGWTLPGIMVPEFDKTMMAAEVGKVSEPFRTNYGWHILLVEERRSKDLTQDNARQLARLEIAKTKYDDELNNWLQELRDNSFVEIK
jgi:peptidyl-prolyl cis-trans isomerase SurA